MAQIVSQPVYILRNDFVSFSLPVQKGRAGVFTLREATRGLAFTPAEGSALFALRFKSLLGGETIRTDELKVRDAALERQGGTQTLRLFFAPFRVRGCRLALTYEAALGDADGFVRARLILQSDRVKGPAVLDSIDFAPFVMPQGATGWCLPAQKKALVGPVPLSLGQPVFIDNCFFGCEFPAAHNTIRDGVASARRYYGKPLQRLLGQEGSLATDRCVYGAACSAVIEAVRAAFFGYIESIARPARPRVQYNGWFDHMLDIDETTLEQDVLQLDRDRNEAGCPAMDAFVIDDGWNDYDAPFWTMNEKFPQGLAPLAQKVGATGASLGLWIGPRGGYNGKTASFGKRIEAAHNGFYHKKSRDICVASRRYCDKLAQFMQMQNREGGLSYWKIDGMAAEPCRSKLHDHAVGGEDDLYYYSDLWESWIDLFERLHQSSPRPLFLNLTSYATPSPWLFQWVQSLWIQNSLDIGFTKGKKGEPAFSTALTYRDGRYYDFYTVRQFCVPPARLYHHDPIYGAHAKLDMTDEEFFAYLFAVAARGSNLGEFYFGCGKMTPQKWRVCRAAEAFAAQNRTLLRHTVFFGGDPLQGEICGYAAFDANAGLLTLRNPADKPQTWSGALNETLGVKKSFALSPAAQLLPLEETGELGAFSFGDELTVSLAPYQTKILRFGAIPAPQVTRVRARDAHTVEVQTDRPLFWQDARCESNPVEAAAPTCDGCTAVLRFRYAFNERSELTLCGLRDPLGQPQTLLLRFPFAEDGVLRSGGLQGKGGFSVKITFDPLLDKQLFRQGGDAAVTIDQNHVLFRVGQSCLRSRADVRDMVQLCAVREDSGVLKLYLNGQLDSGLLPPGEPHDITLAPPSCADPARTKLYCRPLAFDEV